MRFKQFSLSLSLTNLRSLNGSEAKDKVSPQNASDHDWPSNIDPYAAAGQEVLTGEVIPSLWARAMVEGKGAEGPTQAAYIRLRVTELEAEAEESRRELEQAARQEMEAKEQRIKEIQALAAEYSVTNEQAEEMLDHGIRKENGQFVLFLDEDGRGYAYDQLHYAVQYSKKRRSKGSVPMAGRRG